ncbi:hypothetical protein Cylst_1729 [Cylindrospermum stagnale PCC 7417]|uniref:Uncharacterized protein n=1 Tax=Cylindrospermum stagnale PCC 7417 TaxID=56107 RepID=K9WUD7_9NOST|nr:hypothetical protein [Cylindrospermum stagnale]AFZ24000.1 hypothetical protein Cylst_1729 [Cylindrospermum stagnale PCC 7417]
MSEKILLAVILTFSLNLFAQMSLPSSSQETAKMSLQNQEVLALTQLRK